MKDSKTKDAAPADFIAALAARNIQLHSDGVRIWTTPATALSIDEHAYATRHNDSLVKLVATPSRTEPEN